MPARKTDPETSVESIIRFRLLRNIMINDLAEHMNGRIPLPPMQMKEERAITRQAYVEERDPTTGYATRVLRSISPIFPHFDLAHLFEIVLEPVHPREVKREDGMSEAWWTRLMDREMTRAVAARESQEKLRRTLAHYQKQGSIEIVEDPSGLLDQEPFLSDAEYQAQKERGDHAKFAACK